MSDAKLDLVRALQAVKEDATFAWKLALGGDFSGLHALAKSWHNLEVAVMKVDLK